MIAGAGWIILLGVIFLFFWQIWISFRKAFGISDRSRVLPSWIREVNLTGKVAIVTGANSGMGFKVALFLARKNATVVMACRSALRAKKAMELIKEDVGEHCLCDVIPLDLSSFSSIKEFARLFLHSYQKLDFLYNNAGVLYLFGKQPIEKTPEGFNFQIFVNYVGHFLLVHFLWDIIIRSNTRVVNASSCVHRLLPDSFPLSKMKGCTEYHFVSYMRSKLAMICFTKKLQKRFLESESQATAVSVDPGIFSSNIVTIPRPWIDFLYKAVLPKVDDCMESVLCALLHSSLRGAEYLVNTERGVDKGKTHTLANSSAFCDSLWEYSCEILRKLDPIHKTKQN